MSLTELESFRYSQQRSPSPCEIMTSPAQRSTRVPIMYNCLLKCTIAQLYFNWCTDSTHHSCEHSTTLKRCCPRSGFVYHNPFLWGTAPASHQWRHTQSLLGPVPAQAWLWQGNGRHCVEDWSRCWEQRETENMSRYTGSSLKAQGQVLSWNQPPVCCLRCIPWIILFWPRGSLKQG